MESIRKSGTATTTRTTEIPNAIEIGGASDGIAVLIVPGDVADFAEEQLRLYELRQYPVVGGANHFYETLKIDPSILETVFTTNITLVSSFPRN